MASYEAKIGGHTVTVTHQQGGTNQMGVKKTGKIKAWATCPATGKKIEAAEHSVGEATRAVEQGVAKSIEEAAAQPVEA